jgi:hypothetical protein
MVRNWLYGNDRLQRKWSLGFMGEGRVAEFGPCQKAQTAEKLPFYTYVYKYISARKGSWIKFYFLPSQWV